MGSQDIGGTVLTVAKFTLPSIILLKDLGPCCPSLGGGQRQPSSVQRRWLACPRLLWLLQAEGVNETPREDLMPKRI